MYLDELTFLGPIEKGGYSTVWKVIYKGKKYALKMISKDGYKSKISKRNLKMEIKIHKQLNHENIIKLYNTFEDDFYMYMLMELGEEDLFYFLEKHDLSDNDILNISYQLVQAIAYLNGKNIIHGDLKMENILMVNDKIKICDFGLSSQNFFHFGYVGTPEYMAPEIIKKQIYNYKVDIWAFGIILYNLVYGMHPFDMNRYSSKDNNLIKNIICNKEIIFTKDTIFNDLISKCLEKDKLKRITIEDLQNHKLFEIFSNIK